MSRSKEKAERPEPALRADARRNRQKLLEVARELFALQGVGIGIDDVARKAGVGIGTVYRHFPTKEALFQATVASHMEETIADARTRKSAEDAGEAFFSFLERLVERGIEKKNLIDALSRDGVDVPHMPPELAASFRAALHDLLTRAQRAGAVRSDVQVDELQALIRGTFSAMRGESMNAVARRRMLDIISDGLKARPSTRRRPKS